MSRSVLLQLARDSIQEVLEGHRTIDKKALLEQHPLLHEIVATTVNIFIDSKLRGTSSTQVASSSLLEDIVRNAKIAAFLDKNSTPISTSEYLSCEVELILNTVDGVMSEKDSPILKNGANPLANLE